MEVEMNIDNEQNNTLSPTERKIYQKNKELNKQRIGFFTFLMNSAKGEMAFDGFQKILFWNGIFDIFLFFICFCLFCSYASQFWRNIFFVGHAVRGVVSLLILKYLPRTSTIIQNLENFENESLEVIHNKIYEEYKKLLMQNENRIRPSMYTYWIITIIDFLIDIIIFFVLLHEWGDKEYNFRNIATLIIIVLLFGSNFSMLSWFGELKYFLPPEMSGPIVHAALFHSKKLIEAIRNTMKKNVLTRNVGSSLRK